MMDEDPVADVVFTLELVARTNDRLRATSTVDCYCTFEYRIACEVSL